MATNLSSLPQLQATFAVTTNSDWRDTIQFQWAAGTPKAGQPIDLTGIDFFAQAREGYALQLDLSTTNSLLVVDAALGTLSFAVPRNGALLASMSRLQPGVALSMDILAVGDGETVNLMQVGGPATINVSKGVTSIT